MLPYFNVNPFSPALFLARSLTNLLPKIHNKIAIQLTKCHVSYDQQLVIQKMMTISSFSKFVILQRSYFNDQYVIGLLFVTYEAYCNVLSYDSQNFVF